MDRMAGASERVGRALGTASTNAAGFEPTRQGAARAAAQVQRLERAIAATQNAERLRVRFNGFEEATRAASVTAEQLRAAQLAVSREYGETLHRASDEMERAHREAAQQIAEAQRRATSTLDEARRANGAAGAVIAPGGNEGERRRLDEERRRLEEQLREFENRRAGAATPPPPLVGEAKDAYDKRLREREDRIRNIERSAGIIGPIAPPPPLEPGANADRQKIYREALDEFDRLRAKMQQAAGMAPTVGAIPEAATVAARSEERARTLEAATAQAEKSAREKAFDDADAVARRKREEQGAAPANNMGAAAASGAIIAGQVHAMAAANEKNLALVRAQARPLQQRLDAEDEIVRNARVASERATDTAIMRHENATRLAKAREDARASLEHAEGSLDAFHHDPANSKKTKARNLALATLNKNAEMARKALERAEASHERAKALASAADLKEQKARTDERVKAMNSAMRRERAISRDGENRERETRRLAREEETGVKRQTVAQARADKAAAETAAKTEAERVPTIGERVRAGAKGIPGAVGRGIAGTAHFAAQGVMQNAIFGFLHEGFEGAKEISGTRDAERRLRWTPAQQQKARETAAELVRKYPTMTLGEAEQMYRELATTQETPNDAALLAPILAKQFQNQVQSGGDRHKAGSDTTRLIKAGEMFNELLGADGQPSPEKTAEFYDVVSRAQLVMGARIIDARHIQGYAKYSRTAGSAQDTDAKAMAFILAGEEAGTTAGVMLNAFTRNAAGRATQEARAQMIENGLATGEVKRGKTGKANVLNYQVNDEQDLRRNQFKWLDSHVLQPGGPLDRLGINKNDPAAVSAWANKVTSNQVAADALTKMITQRKEWHNLLNSIHNADNSDEQAQNAGNRNLNVATNEMSAAMVTATQRASEAVAPVLVPAIHWLAHAIEVISKPLDNLSRLEASSAATRHAAAGPGGYASLGSIAALGAGAWLLGKAYENPGATAEIGAAAALTGAAGALTGSAGALTASAGAQGIAGALGSVVKFGAALGGLTLGLAALDAWSQHQLDAKGGAKRLAQELDNPPSDQDPGKTRLQRMLGGMAGITAPIATGRESAAAIDEAARRRNPDAVDNAIDIAVDAALRAAQRRAGDDAANDDMHAWLTDRQRGPGMLSLLGITPAYAEDGPAARYSDYLATMDDNEMARRNGARSVDAGGFGGTGADASGNDAMAAADEMLDAANIMMSVGDGLIAAFTDGSATAQSAISSAFESGGSSAAEKIAAAVANITVNVQGAGADRANPGTNPGLLR